MTDLSTPAAEGGNDGAPESATPSLLELQAIAEGEVATEVVEQPDPEAEAAKKAAEDEAAKVKAPLPPEEVEKRWRQTQGALKQSRADLAAMRRELTELKTAKSAPEPEMPPAFAEDPIAAGEWMQAQFRAQQEQSKRSAEEIEVQRQQTEFVNALQSDEAAAVAAYPDYHEALQYLRDHRRAELLDLGANDDNVEAMVAQEFVQGIRAAQAQGLSPARMAYKLAAERGYAKPEPKPAVDALKNIEAGAAAARTLSANGGRSEASTGSIESRISNLSGAALRDAWRKHKTAARG